MVDLVSWYAIQTRSRHEKVVAEQLWQKGIECFLPLYEKVSRWKDRRKLVSLPLFPGYLFVHANISERKLDILKVPSVVRVVGFSGRAESIDGKQIQAVKELVFREIPVDPHPYLAVGDRVRIVRGPLCGLEGILLEKKGKFRFVLSIDIIRQAVSCEISAADVEKI